MSRSLYENREPTAEKLDSAIFPMIFVIYTQYSPQIMEKSDLNPLSLATASILGQPPR